MTSDLLPNLFGQEATPQLLMDLLKPTETGWAGQKRDCGCSGPWAGVDKGPLEPLGNAY